MTTLAPIDIEESESAVLIDYENIRLSWEKAYSRLFTYTDLCWLCELTERRFRTAISRIVVFMSDPSECEETCCPEQLDEMKKTLKYLQNDQARKAHHPAAAFHHHQQQTSKSLTTTSTVVELDISPRRMTESSVVEKRQLDSNRRKRRRRFADKPGDVVVDLSSSDDDDDDVSKPSSSHSDRGNIEAVSDDSADPLPEDDVEITSVVLKGEESEDQQPFARLGIEVCPKTEVIVKVFQYKRQRNIRVQRCCDVEIGVEVTKICFMPFFSSIFLFSADSDFEMTARQCAEAEVYGGIIKYAKPIRILGFSRAFERATFLNARDEFRERKNAWMQYKQRDRSHNPVAFFLIDYEFPAIRRTLERSNRPLLPLTALRSGLRSIATQPPSRSSRSPVDTSSIPVESPAPQSDSFLPLIDSVSVVGLPLQSDALTAKDPSCELFALNVGIVLLSGYHRLHTDGTYPPPPTSGLNMYHPQTPSELLWSGPPSSWVDPQSRRRPPWASSSDINKRKRAEQTQQEASFHLPYYPPPLVTNHACF